MKQRLKRIGSLFLALCMVVSLLPGAVFAGGGDEFTIENLAYKVLTEDNEAKTGTVVLVGYEGSGPTGTLTVAEAVYNNGINYSITEIGEEAFQGTNITEINLPASVEVIGEYAFNNCGELKEFTVDESNLNFSDENGVLLSKDKKTLILYPAGKVGKTYTIPDSVETIGEIAFAGNEKLTEIDTTNVVTISKNAFNSSALVGIDIGDFVKTIGENAFYSCMDLTEVNFSESSSLETIGDGVFAYCASLREINLPASLKTIGEWVFSCYELESISLGKNVEFIGTNAIYNVPRLKTLTVDSDNANYMTEDNILYNKGKTTLIRYAPGKSETTFEISNTVTKIEEYAFYGAGNLIDVTVPDSIETIGDEAFLHSNFTSITFLGDTPPIVGNKIFSYCNNLTNIYVPSSSMDAYKTVLGTEYAPKIKAQATIDQTGWEALIANPNTEIKDGDIIILGEDVTGNLSRTTDLSNLTIEGNGHTINGRLWFGKEINLTLKDITVQGPDDSEAIRLSTGGKLKTIGKVEINGGNGIGYLGMSGVFSGIDLTITASDGTKITAGDASEDFNLSGSAVWVQSGNLTLDGGSPIFQGGKGYSSYGALVGRDDNLKDLIISSGSPKLIGGSFNDSGSNGAFVYGGIHISSAGSPEFIGADGKENSYRANGAWAHKLEITAGSPKFKGGSVSKEKSYAGHGISLYDSATISGNASPSFTGGNGVSLEYGGDGLNFTECLTISTSGDAEFIGGSNCQHGIGQNASISGTQTGINLKNLKGKIIADSTKGEYSAIGLYVGCTITYPDGLAEAKKYNGTSKMYVLDMGDMSTVYTATLNINLDDSPFTSQVGGYTLKLEGNESTTFAMNGSGATRTAEVPKGTWKVYENFDDIYTGVKITINDAPTSGTLDYYTVKYSATKEGTTSEGRIELSVTTLDGVELDNISYLIKGDKASFAATGMGAESYTYRWNGTHGTETISSTGSIYTINPVQGKIDITCTIKGTGISSGPIPGNSGIITVANITQNSLTLNWANATRTVEGGLKYAVFQSKGANISTVSECTSHPELLLNEPHDINTYAVSGLSPNTTYYFNVVVLDDNMGMAAYTMVSAKTSSGGNEGNGGGGNGSGSGGSSSGSTTTQTTITSENKPNQPITASAPITATAGIGGTANAAITDKIITDTIAKAQADAKAQGKTVNGTSVALNVTMPQGATALTVTLTPNSLNSLVSAGVTSLEINGAPVSLELDLAALKEIQRQSGGNITISIAPATGLSKEAKALMGNRPVYNITISTVKDGKTTNVTSLGNGTATLFIHYTPGKNEAVSYLFGVYVDAKGKATQIDGSTYDTNARAILLSTNHFSVYGVGYTAPSAKFTDISTHWGKEAIDYVVGRGLLSGTSETTFAPNTAMTRGMLVTALGRLAGEDTKLYNTNSFIDVKADSAFRPYIEWGYQKGIVHGIGNQQFAPDRAITREEIAVIFANYAKSTGYKLPVTREATTYADTSSIGSAYKTAVMAMQQAGIMMGGTDNKFNPKASATRAEVSSMLHRYIKLTIDPVTAQGWALNDVGQWLYYKEGKALTSTQTIDGTKYFFNTDGTLKTGWVKEVDNWRYYSGNKILTGWCDIGSDATKKTYYFETNGNMISGKWLQIDDKWYYLGADGSLAKNTTIDGHEVDDNGVRKNK